MMKRRPAARTSPNSEDAQLERLARKSLARLVISPPRVPSAVEVARREKLVQEIARFRETIGTLPFSVDDLIREDREEENG